jgi:hypothetical protein
MDSLDNNGTARTILFYADESGTSLGDKNSPFFILVAIAIEAEEYRCLS